jgi:hypothetical protein
MQSRILEPTERMKTEKHENVRVEIIIRPTETDYTEKEALKRILELGYENRDIIEEFDLNRDSAKIVIRVPCGQDLNKMRINNAYLFNRITANGSQDKVKKEHPPADNNISSGLQFLRHISHRCRDYLLRWTGNAVVTNKKASLKEFVGEY